MPSDERIQLESLAFGIFAGVFGMAYFSYGKKQAKLSAMFSGVALCVYPYFFDSLLWLSVVGAALLIAPLMVEY